MSDRCHQRTSRLDAVLLVELVRFGGVNGQALLKRLCKTNCAAPRGTSHNKPTSWQWKSRTRDAHTSMRILELENRCTGNRTVASNPTLSATTILAFQGFWGGVSFPAYKTANWQRQDLGRFGRYPLPHWEPHGALDILRAGIKVC